MTTHDLLPTEYYSPEERLLHGKGVASAVGAGRAEDWVELDQSVAVNTWSPERRWRRRGELRVGFHWFDMREIADWDTAPHWHGPAAGTETEDGSCSPSWRPPLTESELALGLCHEDPRLRLAALGLAADGGLPASVLPFVLIRCADTDGAVRELARSVIGPALAGADDTVVRGLAPLALLLGPRRYGDMPRDLVLSRTGGTPPEAVAELLAGRQRETRIAGLRSGAEAGSGPLGVAEAFAVAEGDPDFGVREHAVRAAVRIAVRAAAEGNGRVHEEARARLLTFFQACRDVGVGHASLTAAQDAGLVRPEDLARSAVLHPEPALRRRCLAVLLAGPEGDLHLDLLLTARDAVVRAAAVERLRPAGRGGELVRHLTDGQARVRAVACRELRAAGGDPHAYYRELCADPAAVTPAAVTGLAEERSPEDVPLLRSLVRHAHGPVRARALAALRMLGALPGDGPAPFADDPDPSVRSTVLSAVRDSPDALRLLLTLPYGDMRAAALARLASDHGLDWREALPFLDDPAPEVARAATDALRRRGDDIPVPLLLDLATPARPRARRAAGLALIRRHGGPESLLAGLRLADDPDPTVRDAARREAVWGLRRLEEEVGGTYGDEIRLLVERHAAELPRWYQDIRRRQRAERGR
ncbi:HEAT repeat domain-containing protein [Streptomyces sp. NPDC002773]|uniref:HEAT repeat domain-containing protein n=1 Tax=Streptomyces sp. NPDC002773 TaxID=3154430 RepID=UPI00331FD67E